MCECVVVLRGLKDVSWGGAKSMMADGNFLRSLVDFDKDSLTEKQVRTLAKGSSLWEGAAWQRQRSMPSPTACACPAPCAHADSSAVCDTLPVQVKKVKEYMKDPSFTYEGLRSISIAGAGLLKWVLV